MPLQPEQSETPGPCGLAWLFEGFRGLAYSGHGAIGCALRAATAPVLLGALTEKGRI